MTLPLGRATAAAILGALLGAASLAFFYALGSELDVGFTTDPPPGVIGGVYPAQRVEEANLTIAWTGREVTLRLPELDRTVPWTLALRVRGARPDPVENPELTFFTDGLLIGTHQTATNFESVQVTIPARPERRKGAVVSIYSSKTHVAPGDPRPRGVMLDELTLTPDGIVLPPGRAFTGAVGAPAAFGATTALLGVTSGSAIGSAVLISIGIAAVIARGFGPFTPFPITVLRLSLWIGAAVVIVLGVERFRGRRLRNTARFVVAFSGGALLLKLAILLHPDMPVPHFQAALLSTVSVASTPLATFVRRAASDIALLQFVVVAADAAAGALLYQMIVRAWGDRRAGAIAIAVYQLVPLDFRVITVGNLTDAFAQSLSTAALAIMAAVWLRWDRLWSIAVLTLVLAAAFLFHASSSAILAVGTALVAAAFAWRGGPVLRSPSAAVAVALGLALALALALYYGRFSDTYQAELALIRSETPSATPDPGGPGIIGRLASVPQHLANHFGVPALLLAIVGARRLWQQGARDRLALVLVAWTVACLLFLIIGVPTPMDMRYYLAAIPAVAIAAGAGASSLWGKGGRRRLVAAVLLAWIAWIGVDTWWHTF